MRPLGGDELEELDFRVQVWYWVTDAADAVLNVGMEALNKSLACALACTYHPYYSNTLMVLPRRLHSRL